ncbi:MAG: ABC transporter ATP-binding protein [Rhizobiaceae bacterium]|nr:ABC transporter ATP-binding protein [Rhizobiaceae bacterium]
MNAPTRPLPAAVSAADLELSYGATAVLRGIDFSLPKGQTLALLGPSGCGKTTLLRLVAGLLSPTRGRISIGEKTVADAANGAFLPPERRGLGMVFQDYALWPHMTVGGNVSFPLEMRGIGKAERKDRTLRALQRVGLGQYADRKTSELSGGQQQRVAIARAIVAEPALILFDEPLSNLDRELRETMVGEIGNLISSLGLTAIYVTHDHSEALSLADQVAIMRGGRIEQLAPPDILVDRPATPNVADFLRLGCVAAVKRHEGFWRLAQSGAAIAAEDATAVDSTHALLPLAAIELLDAADARINGTVLRSQFRGDGHLATVQIGSGEGRTELQLISRTKLRAGEPVGLRIDPQQIRWFSSQDYR